MYKILESKKLFSGFRFALTRIVRAVIFKSNMKPRVKNSIDSKIAVSSQGVRNSNVRTAPRGPHISLAVSGFFFLRRII